MRAFILTTTILLSGAPAFAFTSLGTSPGQSATGEGVVSTQAGLTGEERFNAAGTPGTCQRQVPFGFSILGNNGTDYTLGAGDSSHRLSPSGDGSCYLSLGSVTGNQTVELDFNPGKNGTYLTYLGFYWGSMDEYNSITALNPSGVVPFFTNGDCQSSVCTLTGDTVATTLDPSYHYNYGVGPYPNHFVEFNFDPADHVTRIDLTSTNYAFELDNIAYITAKAATPFAVHAPVPLPEKGSGLVLGLSALGLAAARRRRVTKAE